MTEAVDDGEVAAVLAAHFGVRGRLTRIATEKDDAFKLSAEDRDYLVKVPAPDEPLQTVELQASALTHLEKHAPELPVQRLVRTATGDPYATCRLSGELRLLWVVEFVQGTLLADADPSPELLGEVGRVHARVSLALRDFAHQGEDRMVIWDLKNFASLRHLLEWAPAERHRRLAETVFDRFDAEVTPRIGDLERQFVHGDMSPYNVIVDTGGRHVAGVIDFGDAVRTPLIFDLSIPVSNLLDSTREHPWASGLSYLRGFLAELRLPDADLTLLSVTAPARLTLRALLQAQRAHLAPERGEYLLSHGRRDWDDLEAALAVPRHEVRARLVDSPREEPPS